MTPTARRDGTETCFAACLLEVPVRLRVPAGVSVEVRRRLDSMVASGTALDPGQPVRELEIRMSGQAFGATTSAGVELCDPDPAVVAIALVTAETVSRSPRLCMHAGVVTHAGGVLAIPGASGHGKTTLVAALVQAGFGYLSDEVLSVSRTDAGVAAFRRPLSLGHDAWQLLGLDAEQQPVAGREALVDLAQLGRPGCAPQLTDIVGTQRDGSRAALERTARGSAVETLLRRCFNHFDAPASSFETIVGLVRNSQVWHAGYRDAPELAAVLAARFGVTTGNRQQRADLLP